MGEQSQSLFQLPLEALHVQAGAKFGPFAGWNMPITYPLGVMKEHLHTREHAGLFDISHMKAIEVTGSGAADFLNHALPIDAHVLKQGQSRYNFLLDEKAGILDDLIVTRLGDARFMVVANAGNWREDVAELERRKGNFNCTITPLDRVLLALQGPKAVQILTACGLDLDVGSMAFMTGKEPRENWFVTRSGYTGEDGFEIAIPIEDGEKVATALLESADVTWIGLAARDSLRLEAGLCLHGQDITPDYNPIEATLTWAVTKAVREKAGFVGAEAYLNALEQGPSRRRVGLVVQGRQPVRGGAEIFDDMGEKIGLITSGGFGPSFDAPVAMGYLPTSHDINKAVFADVRGKKIEMKVHPTPFIPHTYFKG